jgi:hypothetical protein
MRFLVMLGFAALGGAWTAFRGIRATDEELLSMARVIGTRRSWLARAVCWIAFGPLTLVGVGIVGAYASCLARYVAGGQLNPVQDLSVAAVGGGVLAVVGLSYALAMPICRGPETSTQPDEQRRDEQAGCPADRPMSPTPCGVDWPPVWLAVARNDTRELHRLLSAGADPDALGDRGLTALHVAAERDHAAAVEILLTAGADPNRSDPHGNGPLWAAVHRACLSQRTDGSLEVVRLLAAAGADPDHTNHHGRSPRDSAAARDSFVASLLAWPSKPRALGDCGPARQL